MEKTIIETAQPFRMFHNERDSKKIQRPPQLLKLIHYSPFEHKKKCLNPK
jgi:hypothetical protein